MTTYQSDVKTIFSSQEAVFNILSDLNNLQKMMDHPSVTEKIKDLQFDTDSCSFQVDAIGRIGFRIASRTPNSSLQFESEHVPVAINVHIELHREADVDTKMKIILHAELPNMIKMMVGDKLQNGVNSMADLLAKSLNNQAMWQ